MPSSQILTSTLVRRILVMIAVATLSGCAKLDRVADDVDRVVTQVRESVQGVASAITLPPADRPTYSEGQTFFYGRDSVRRVRQLNDDGITWGDRDRELFRTTGHFFLPRTYQDFDDRTLERSFEGDPAALWPLSAGKEVEFIERRSIYRKLTDTTDQTERRWHCVVEDPRVVDTLAGSFDSYRVTCRSYSMGFTSVRSLSPIQVVYWDYAPRIGHYVRRESWLPRSGQRSVRELSAALPAALASPRRIDAVLERLARADWG